MACGWFYPSHTHSNLDEVLDTRFPVPIDSTDNRPSRNRYRPTSIGLTRLQPSTMSHLSNRGRAPRPGANPGAYQRQTVKAHVNLFKISLDRMGKTVYQYDGKFLRLPPSL